jgi:hypothetical protein
MNISNLYPRAVLSKTDEENKNNIKETYIKIQSLKLKDFFFKCFKTALISLLQGSSTRAGTQLKVKSNMKF